MLYTTAVIQAKCERSTTLENENNYLINVHSEFTDNNPNLNAILASITKPFYT